MLHYFYLVNHSWWETQLRPALAASWRQRTFAPCHELCRQLIAKAALPNDAVVRRVGEGLPFARMWWQALIGECLIFGADAMPRLPCAIAALRCLLAPGRIDADPANRAAFVPIEQVYYGSRDLRFAGGWHRPDYVGWNDAADVVRLADYLRSVDPNAWTTTALTPLSDLPDEAERAEELAYLRDWWPSLVETYEQAHIAGQVIVCERT